MPNHADPRQILIDRLKRAQAVAQIGSWELDLQTRTMWGSEEAFRVYGLALTSDQLLPLQLVQEVPLPQYRPVLDRALSDLVAGKSPYDVEFEIRRPSDGKTRFIHSVAELVPRGDGVGPVVVGTLHDITARRMAEEALRASEERFRMFLEHAADAIVIFDETGLLELNARASVLSGHPREALLGQQIHFLFGPEELERVPLQYDRVRRGEAVVTERALLRADGTTVPVEMHSKQLPSGVYLTIFRDITERRRLEDQLQLRQRMDSVGTLASGIAHDFNNILVAILGYAELLNTEEPDLTPAGRDGVDQILSSARRAADLVRRLQLLGRPDRRRSIAFDLSAPATDVFKILSETTDRRIGKVMNIPAGSCWVAGRESDVYHALTNLGLNAVQAIEERGPRSGDVVRIDATTEDIPDGHPMALPPGRYVHIRFSDTGPGMSPEVRTKAFDPLFSTKDKGVRKGQGLGLTMVYNIVVVQHSGAIDVESEVDRGTTFHLYLPTGRLEEAAETARVGQSPMCHGTVLVVEDEPQVAELAQRVLEKEGCRVLVAGDGQSALDLYSVRHADIDIAIVDYTLPVLNGLAVIDAMFAIKAGQKIILTSGDVVPLAGDLATRVLFLPKPYPLASLRESVAAVLSR